ncbi:unnamed protein product [Moneuplotes crassus]|uniref:Uncharacterized protein n=1 Tax=Euplotes crassus TaxID=5936 RepID=A0AAD1XEC4_EUPCR|nr:unnamed protein product [Moneuplotes crassus]
MEKSAKIEESNASVDSKNLYTKALKKMAIKKKDHESTKSLSVPVMALPKGRAPEAKLKSKIANFIEGTKLIPQKVNTKELIKSEKFRSRMGTPMRSFKISDIKSEKERTIQKSLMHLLDKPVPLFKKREESDSKTFNVIQLRVDFKNSMQDSNVQIIPYQEKKRGSSRITTRMSQKVPADFDIMKYQSIELPSPKPMKEPRFMRISKSKREFLPKRQNKLLLKKQMIFNKQMGMNSPRRNIKTVQNLYRSPQAGKDELKRFKSKAGRSRALRKFVSPENLRTARRSSYRKKLQIYRYKESTMTPCMGSRLE